LRTACSAVVSKGRAVFGISGLKLIIILVAGLILIGPDKLPEIAQTIGKGIRMFNEAKGDMEKLIKADMFASEASTPAIETPAPTTTAASAIYADDEDEEGEEE
jgi:sec-independent protein translocase protein TatA